VKGSVRFFIRLRRRPRALPVDECRKPRLNQSCGEALMLRRIPPLRITLRSLGAGGYFIEVPRALPVGLHLRPFQAANCDPLGKSATMPSCIKVSALLFSRHSRQDAARIRQRCNRLLFILFMPCLNPCRWPSRAFPPLRVRASAFSPLFFLESNFIEGFELGEEIFQLRGSLHFLADQAALFSGPLKIFLVDWDVVEQIQNFHQADFSHEIFLDGNILRQGDNKPDRVHPKLGCSLGDQEGDGRWPLVVTG